MPVRPIVHDVTWCVNQNAQRAVTQSKAHWQHQQTKHALEVPMIAIPQNVGVSKSVGISEFDVDALDTTLHAKDTHEGAKCKAMHTSAFTDLCKAGINNVLSGNLAIGRTPSQKKT